MLIPPVPLQIDVLRALGHAPRLHPNGFIALDLDATHKLHVWLETPIRVRREAARIHDHVFAFVSRILAGVLNDVRYRIEAAPDGTHRVWLTPCKKGRCHVQESRNGLVLGGGPPVRAHPTAAIAWSAGQTYEFPKETLHDSVPQGFVATLLRITDFGDAPSARILFPDGVEPGPYDRTPADVRELRLAWEAIERACLEAA